MGFSVYHRTDVLINEYRLDYLLHKKEWTGVELHERIIKKYGFELKYKAFMTLLSNKITWKLSYAWFIADILDDKIEELFDVHTFSDERIEMEKEYNDKRNEMVRIQKEQKEIEEQLKIASEDVIVHLQSRYDEMTETIKAFKEDVQNMRERLKKITNKNSADKEREKFEYTKAKYYITADRIRKRIEVINNKLEKIPDASKQVALYEEYEKLNKQLQETEETIDKMNELRRIPT